MMMHEAFAKNPCVHFGDAASVWKKAELTMTNTPTMHRVHISLTVSDLDASVAFYARLLGVAPDKRRGDYARFVPDDIAIQLALNHVESGAPDRGAPKATNSEHFGVVVPSSGDVARVRNRLAAASIATRSENDTVCCYARQDKVWATDPDGRAWEVYTVLDDTEHRMDTTSTCCQPASDASSSAASTKGSRRSVSPQIGRCC